ncbi:MAG TPA: hemerythrin domain-containing protein, partial [Myxococcaceae bacterium]|nr:hemerythrin domain-containing protein [Myxococcaceae bacterium]
HLAVKRVIADLLQMEPGDENFDAKVKVLQDLIEHHVEEEHEELFPKVKKNFTAEELEALGAEMEEMFLSLRSKEPRKNVPAQTAEAAPLD